MARLLTLVIFGLLCILVVLFTTAGKRTYSVTATTLGGKIAFRGETNDWFLETATICALKKEPELRAATKTTEPLAECNRNVYDIYDAENWLLEWPAGTRLHFRRAGEDGLEFLLDSTISVEIDAVPRNGERSTLKELPRGSLVILSGKAWRNQGALAFNGVATLGGPMATASRDYLLDGYWEARQTGFATAVFRDLTEVVKSGRLSRGATVDFVRLREDDGVPPNGRTGGDTASSSTESENHATGDVCGVKIAGPAKDGRRTKTRGMPAERIFEVVSYGHLTPAEDDAPGLVVGLLTEKAPLALRVRHFGLAEPACFKPDWIDTISSSPVILALAILFSVIAGFIELLLAINNARMEIFEEQATDGADGEGEESGTHEEAPPASASVPDPPLPTARE